MPHHDWYLSAGNAEMLEQAVCHLLQAVTCAAPSRPTRTATCCGMAWATASRLT
jgi:hypothetical protein